MSHINLLPWREELRKLRNRLFLTISSGIIIACILSMFIAQRYFIKETEHEQNNIILLQDETKKISEKIKEIKNLQQDKKDLLHRMEVVQVLQAARGMTVRLLDIIPKTIPDGIYLSEIERKGNTVTITGSAQTNASVSIFIENLQKKEWSDLIEYVELDKIETSKTTGLDFKILVGLINPV